MDPFDQKKAFILQEIASSATDASPKGTIDVKCLPIMEVINNHEHMVTTSSCSGRVSVFLEGLKLAQTQIGAKGHEGRWLFVTHNEEDLGNWWKNLEFKYGISELEEEEKEVEDSKRYILFKYEPFILHVKCRNAETAKQLYSVAMACGYRETGIGSNNVVAVRISIRLDIPIGRFQGDQLKLYVEEQYLEVITKLALSRFTENERKYEQLRKRISEEMFAEPTSKPMIETKEERRIRKINEGMARRDGVLKEKKALKEKKEQERKEKEMRELEKSMESQNV